MIRNVELIRIAPDFSLVDMNETKSHRLFYPSSSSKVRFSELLRKYGRVEFFSFFTRLKSGVVPR